MIVPTPPAVTNPSLKPTLPIQQFKRQLYTQSDEPLVFHVRIQGTKVGYNKCSLICDYICSLPFGYQPAQADKPKSCYLNRKRLSCL